MEGQFKIVKNWSDFHARAVKVVEEQNGFSIFPRFNAFAGEKWYKIAANNDRYFARTVVAVTEKRSMAITAAQSGTLAICDDVRDAAAESRKRRRPLGEPAVCIAPPPA